MRALFFGILFFTSIFRAHAADPKPIDIVFDLDDTLIRWVRPAEKVPAVLIPLKGPVNGYRYRVLDGAPEILQFCETLNKLGVRVSFFSLGEGYRNIEVLKDLKLPDGRSAFDIAYKIFSDVDAVKVNGENLKDLRLINPDLSRVLIVDDRFATTVPGQEMNVVHILPKVLHFYSDVEEGQDPTNFVQNRNKLTLGAAIIERMMAKVDEKVSPVEALTQVQFSHDPTGKLQYRENLVDDIRLYREGAAIFHRMNSKYTFTPAFGKETIQMLRRRCELLLLPE